MQALAKRDWPAVLSVETHDPDVHRSLDLNLELQDGQWLLVELPDSEKF